MKLLTKTTLYIATLSVFLFFLMGIIFFQFLKNMSSSELNRELTSISESVKFNLPRMLDGTLRNLPGIDSISITPLTGDDSLGIPVNERMFGDTLMFDAKSEQFRTYRYIHFIAEHDGIYLVKLFRSTTPADKLVERVTLMMTLLVILFLAGIFLLNRFIFTNLWKDFFMALEKLKQFDSDKEPVVLGEPDIEEFVELKKVLERMTSRLASDYRELKEYTDHTTHELQTPLAVIKTKTELLLQSDRLGEEEIRLIQSINVSADLLSRLNSTLALITRIENRQFTSRKRINLPGLVDEHLELLQELIELRGIKVKRDYQDREKSVVMDQGLAQILVTNLLKNAVVHNSDEGSIFILVDKDGLIISNDGPPLSFDQRELFKRYVRDMRKSGNFGLGLWLVRKICEYYGYKIGYSYRNERHIFNLVVPE